MRKNRASMGPIRKARATGANGCANWYARYDDFSGNPERDKVNSLGEVTTGSQEKVSQHTLLVSQTTPTTKRSSVKDEEVKDEVKVRANVPPAKEWGTARTHGEEMGPSWNATAMVVHAEAKRISNRIAHTKPAKAQRLTTWRPR